MISQKTPESMIKLVVSGASAKDVVTSVLDTSTKVCPVCNENNSLDLGECKRCGSPYLVKVKNEGSVDNKKIVKQPLIDTGGFIHTLSHIRPDDSFRFINCVPDDELQLTKVYTSLPSNRGYISFTDGDRDVYVFPIDCCSIYPIQFLNSVEKDTQLKKYTHGDRVRFKINDVTTCGTVICSHGSGYFIKPDDQEPLWVPSSVMNLIDKNKTTASYIRYIGDGWVLKIGTNEHHSIKLIECIIKLFQINRSAFNRWSSYMFRVITNNNHNVDTVVPQMILKEPEIIKWLIHNDPYIWSKFKKADS